MSQFKTVFLIALILFISHICWAHGFRYGVWNERATARESTRWTLSEWMTQKQRNSLQDQWLSMNSPSPFEFYLKGAFHSGGTKVGTAEAESYKSSSGGIGAYAQAVGLTGEYENNTEENYNDVSGLLNIRIIGNSLQNTGITLSVGQRTRQLENAGVSEEIKNNFGQVGIQAYFTRYFGMQGIYRTYSKDKNDALGDVDGKLVEGGLFIDFKGIRVFGSWYEDTQSAKLNSVETKTTRTGIKSGLQIFF